MNFQAVIFDMDGVIFDSERLSFPCWQETAKVYDMHDIETFCDRVRGISTAGAREIFRDMYGYSEERNYDVCKKHCSSLFHARYDGGFLPMKKGAEALLFYLKKRKIPVGLASSTRGETVRREIADAGLNPYFDTMITGDMIAHGKPEPDIFLTAATQLKADPKHCIVIEDSYNGIRGAYRAGMAPIMVPDMLPVNDEMLKLTHRIFPDLSAVQDWIDRDCTFLP